MTVLGTDASHVLTPNPSGIFESVAVHGGFPRAATALNTCSGRGTIKTRAGKTKPKNK
jgi:hypothetical protein